MKLPAQNVPVIDANGRMNHNWWRYFHARERGGDDADATIESLEAGKASATQTFAEAALIETPQDKAYPFVGLNLEGTITEVVTQCASGSCTVTVSINGQDLGGSASSVTTTKDRQPHASRNEIQDGDDVTITISNNSSAADVSVTLRGTRTLA